MSRRCRPGMPASLSHTLRSTVQRCGPTIDCWEFALTTPDGSGNVWNFSVFFSNFTTPDWNMCEIESSLRVVGPLHGNGELGVLQRLRIESAEKLLVELRVPDDAVRIDDHVV